MKIIEINKSPSIKIPELLKLKQTTYAVLDGLEKLSGLIQSYEGKSYSDGFIRKYRQIIKETADVEVLKKSLSSLTHRYEIRKNLAQISKILTDIDNLRGLNSFVLTAKKELKQQKIDDFTIDYLQKFLSICITVKGKLVSELSSYRTAFFRQFGIEPFGVEIPSTAQENPEKSLMPKPKNT